MKHIALFLVVSLLALFAGCAKFWDQVDSQGGIITSHKAPYIVVSQSDDLIMDVYKLQSAIVQSCDGSDWWLFLDENRRPIFLGGDVKTIRLKTTSDPIWQSYNEYHMEDEALSYRDKFNPLSKE